MSPSHDPRLGHFAVGVSPRGEHPARPPRAGRSAGRLFAKGLGVLVAVAAVAGAVVALASAVPEPGEANAVPISHRQWLMIAKDPGAHTGERVVVYGEVAQFDAATGRDTIRADVLGEQNVDEPGTNTILTGDDEKLAAFVEGDSFRAEVTVVGARSYDTQLGGSTVTPELEITAITPVPAS